MGLGVRRRGRPRAGDQVVCAYPTTTLRSLEKHPFAQPQRIGCPILRAVGEGWDATALHPEALARNFCLSHPSRKTRRMGHPILCKRARNTRRHHLAISPGFSSPWVGRRPLIPLSKIKLRLGCGDLRWKNSLSPRRLAAFILAGRSGTRGRANHPWHNQPSIHIAEKFCSVPATPQACGCGSMRRCHPTKPRAESEG